MPRVSVVITARNASAYIAQTLDSILAQEYRDLEVLVVDGGSTDGTVEIVGRRPAVRLIATAPLTKSAGRNAGIRAAQGEYLAFVDADDWWLPSKLARQMAFFQASPACRWVYADCFLYDERSARPAGRWSDRNRLFEGSILEPLFFDCFVPSPTPVVHREVFETVGLYDESFARHEPEDWDLWLRIAARFPTGVIRDPLAYLRMHTASLTSQEDLRLAGEGALAVVERALARNPALPPAFGRRVRAHWYRNFGRGLAGHGRQPEARAFLAKAIRQQPSRPEPYLLWVGTWLLHTLSWPPQKPHPRSPTK